MKNVKNNTKINMINIMTPIFIWVYKIRVHMLNKNRLVCSYLFIFKI